VTAKSGAIFAGVCLATGAALGILAYRWAVTPTVRIVTEPGPVQVVTVDKPVIVARDVTRYVTDTAEVTRLLNEAAAAELRIATLTETVATLKASGADTITYVDQPVPGGTRTVREAHFKDWRLTFDAVDAAATYSLAQRFEALAAVGKDKSGQPTASVRLFEIGPGETRTALTDAKTILVAASPDAPRWRLRASVTAGVGYAGSLSQMRPGGAVGLRWLAYGTSQSAEDSRWAVASPVLWLDKNGNQIGVLPVSVNLGQIKRQPFRDIWVSPFVGVDLGKGGMGKIGMVLHATF